MEKGFYYISDKNFERCYYITNENEGNKVVDFTEIDDDKKKTIINILLIYVINKKSTVKRFDVLFMK